MAQYKRAYVEVDVRFTPDGSMRPRTLIWGDGRKFEIEQILDVRPAHAQKTGGQGDRYRIRIQTHERELFFEHSTGCSSPQVGRWFVECAV